MYIRMYYVTTHRGCSGGGHFKKGIRTKTMRAFKASCNIISDIGAAVAAALAHVSPARTMHHMCERRRRRQRRQRAGLLACLDASISCRIPLES